MNIQIIKTYRESLQDIRSHKDEWIKVACGPYLVWAFALLLIILPIVLNMKSFNTFEMVNNYARNYPLLFLLSYYFYNVVNFIAGISLTINGYRYAIQQEGKDRWINFNFNRRFIKMVIYEIYVGVLGVIYVFISLGIFKGADALFASKFVNMILLIFLGLGAVYVVFRIALFPVAISMDQKDPFKTSWQLMKGNVLRFMGLTFLLWLTFAFVGLTGTVILGLITAPLILGGPILASISLILWVPFVTFVLFLLWALTAKTYGLVCQELSAQRAQ